MLRLFKNWYSRNFSKPGTCEFALVLICVFLIVYYFMWLVGPLVIAVCLAYCLDWGVQFLRRHLRISQFKASVIIMLLFLGISVSILLLLVPNVLKQASEFYEMLQSFGQNAAAVHAETAEGQSMTMADLDKMIANYVMDFVQSLPDPLSTMVSAATITDYVHQLRISVLGNALSVIKTQIMPSMVSAASVLVYMVVVPIFAFLILSDKQNLQRRLSTYILPRDRTLINDLWPTVNFQIESYIRGSLMHILLAAIINTLVFKFFGLNYAILLGLGVGVSVIIPYVGAVVIGIPVIVVSAMQFGMSSTFAWLLAVYVIVQVLDSYALTPLLFSKTMGLDALTILLAIMIFGGLLGFWGVVFAIPLATFIRTLVITWPHNDLPDDKN